MLGVPSSHEEAMAPGCWRIAVAQKLADLEDPALGQPASMSIHEEATYSTVPPTAVMNNPVLYKQDAAE